MGRHKALLDYNGKKFIEIIRDRMDKWFYEIFIVTNNSLPFSDIRQSPVHEDIIEAKGPLGALHTALTVTGKDKVFCIACDMPFGHDPMVKRLIQASEKNGFDCFVPGTIRGPEPLFAIYRKTIRDFVKEEIEAGQLKISEMLKKCRTVYVEIKKDEDELININTPGEYKRYGSKIQDMA